MLFLILRVVPLFLLFCVVFLVPHFSTPSTPPTHPDAGPGLRHGRAMYVHIKSESRGDLEQFAIFQINEVYIGREMQLYYLFC